MSRAEMETLGWDSCDIILVTGDAYIDHPSFGMAIIGRLLEAQGFRVGMISQPDWKDAEDFKKLGKPNLFYGVTSGNMDSMVNRYTSDRRLRHNDSYTPDGEGGKRPDRAVIVYAQRCREAFPGVPIVIGGIEASLRRIAHYDYWSDKIRRSILLDAKADLLLYGNAERALVEVAHRIAKKGVNQDFSDIRGLAFMRDETPEEFVEAHADDLDGDDGARISQGKNRGAPARLRAGLRRRGSLCPRFACAASGKQSRQRPAAGAKARRPQRLADPAAHSADHAGNGRGL